MLPDAEAPPRSMSKRGLVPLALSCALFIGALVARRPQLSVGGAAGPTSLSAEDAAASDDSNDHYELVWKAYRKLMEKGEHPTIECPVQNALCNIAICACARASGDSRTFR